MEHPFHTLTSDPSLIRESIEFYNKNLQTPKVPACTAAHFPWEADTAPDRMVLERRGPADTTMLSLFTRPMFDSTLHRLTNQTAPGADGIPNVVLKHLPPCLHDLIFQLLRFLCATQYTPADWVQEIPTHRFPKRPPFYLNKHYRPITTHKTLLKLWTSCITTILSQFAEEHSLLSQCQQAFRKGRSTSAVVQFLVLLLEDAQASHQDFYALSLDLDNAFNSIEHPHLISIMQQLGFPTDSISIISSLYANATIVVRTPVGPTNPIAIRRGTLQGDPLSTLLFNIMLEPLLRWLDHGTAMRGYTIGHEQIRLPSSGHIHIPPSHAQAATDAYADDVWIYSSTFPALQTQALKASQFSTWSGIPLHGEKCTVSAIFHSQGTLRAATDPDLVRSTLAPLQINGTAPHIILPTEPMKCLGVLVTLSLDWKFQRQAAISHVTDLCTNLSNSSAPPWLKLQTEQTAILTTLYHSFAVCPYDQNTLKMLDKRRANLVKASLRLPQAVPNAAVFLEHSMGGIGHPSLVPVYVQASTSALCTMLNDKGRLGTLARAVFRSIQRAQGLEGGSTSVPCFPPTSTSVLQEDIVSNFGPNLPADFSIPVDGAATSFLHPNFLWHFTGPSPTHFQPHHLIANLTAILNSYHFKLDPQLTPVATHPQTDLWESLNDLRRALRLDSFGLTAPVLYHQVALPLLRCGVFSFADILTADRCRLLTLSEFLAKFPATIANTGLARNVGHAFGFLTALPLINWDSSSIFAYIPYLADTAGHLILPAQQGVLFFTPTVALQSSDAVYGYAGRCAQHLDTKGSTPALGALSFTVGRFRVSEAEVNPGVDIIAPGIPQLIIANDTTWGYSSNGRCVGALHVAMLPSLHSSFQASITTPFSLSFFHISTVALMARYMGRYSAGKLSRYTHLDAISVPTVLRTRLLSSFSLSCHWLTTPFTHWHALPTFSSSFTTDCLFGSSAVNFRYRFNGAGFVNAPFDLAATISALKWAILSTYSTPASLTLLFLRSPDSKAPKQQSYHSYLAHPTVHRLASIPARRASVTRLGCDGRPYELHPLQTSLDVVIIANAPGFASFINSDCLDALAATFASIYGVAAATALQAWQLRLSDSTLLAALQPNPSKAFTKALPFPSPAIPPSLAPIPFDPADFPSLRHLRFHGVAASYTDGSKLDTGALGAAYYSSLSGQTHSATLTGHSAQVNTVTRAELVGIQMCLAALHSSAPLSHTSHFIFSDSQTSLQLIRLVMYRPDSLRMRKHKVLLHQISHLIACLTSLGVTLEFHKIRAHIGIIGNEHADTAAKLAAGASPSGSAPTSTPVQNAHGDFSDFRSAVPFQNLTWISHLTPLGPSDLLPDPTAGWQRADSLKTPVKRQAHKIFQNRLHRTICSTTGPGNSTQLAFFVKSQRHTHLIPTLLPLSLSAPWTLRYPRWKAALALKIRTCQLPLQKYLHRSFPASCPSPACPLCNNDSESVAHALGKCPVTAGLVNKRHGDAAHLIATALRRSLACALFANAETHETCPHLPSWLTVTQTSRPDILLIPTLLDPGLSLLSPDCLDRSAHTIILLEWFHTYDTNLFPRRLQKSDQHTALVTSLKAAGWGTVHIFTLGCSHSGVLTNDFTLFTTTCGLDSHTSDALAASICLHTIDSNIKLLKFRSELKSTLPPSLDGSPPSVEAPPHLLLSPFSGDISDYPPSTASPFLLPTRRRGTRTAAATAVAAATASPAGTTLGTGRPYGRRRRPDDDPVDSPPRARRRLPWNLRSSERPDPG